MRPQFQFRGVFWECVRTHAYFLELGETHHLFPPALSRLKHKWKWIEMKNSPLQQASTVFSPLGMYPETGL